MLNGVPQPRLIEPAVVTESGLANLADLVTRILSQLVSASQSQQPSVASLRLEPGGYSYAGTHTPLAGAPLHVLAALLASRYRCVTAEYVETEVLKDSVAGNIRQAARDAVRTLRKSLREATGTANPLVALGRGADLSWHLRVG